MQRAALLIITILSVAGLAVAQDASGTTPAAQPAVSPVTIQVVVPVAPGLVQQGGFVQQSAGGLTVLAPAGSAPLLKTPIVSLDGPVAAIQAAPAEAEAPTTGFDPGPGDGNVAGAADGLAVADAARRVRGSRGQGTARVYTNEDIQRLNQAPGFRSGDQIEREDALADAAAQPGQAEAAGEGVTPMAPEAEGQPVTEQGAGQTAGVEQNRVVTTPEAQDREGAREELPASASPLPFMALLGLLAGGSGVALSLRRRG